MKTFLWATLLFLVAIFAGCAGSAPDQKSQSQNAPTKKREVSTPSELGKVSVYATDALGRDLDGRIELHGDSGAFFLMPLTEGKAEGEFPAGEYTVLVSVFSEGVPVMAEAEAVSLEPGGSEIVIASILEGTSGQLPLWGFDQDFDMAIDRVELTLGTDPEDASDSPGRRRLDWQSPVLSPDAGWYRGDLHVHSNYHETSLGSGTESVGALIRRAEKQDLDFIAIADRNTMESIYDKDYKSNSVALIPAMEWGTDAAGVALLYGPRVVPELVTTAEEAQAIARMVQAQGGVVVAAHPCFPVGTWTWGLNYLNGVQVWSREWGGVPGIALEALPERLRVQNDSGGHAFSIAKAATHTLLSANEQAERFWMYELQNGLKASVYGGSGSGSKKVPMGEPVTYVFAPEKSARGILRGMWAGMTFVSQGVDGPVVRITADVRADGRYDVGIGGSIPIGVPTEFYVEVGRAQGKKLQIWNNGRIIISKTIDVDGYVHTFRDTPSIASFYHVRIVEPGGRDGVAANTVLAVTSPLYVQEIYIETETMSVHDMWIRLRNEYDDDWGFSPELDPNAVELTPQHVFRD